MLHRYERFSLAIGEIERCRHKLTADEMEKYGLKGPYSVYLITLRRHEEGLTSVQLSELCGRDKSDVSRAISVLEKSGFAVVRCADRMLSDGGHGTTWFVIARKEEVHEKA